MLDETQQQLRTLVAERGSSIVQDPPLCRNLIQDYFVSDLRAQSILTAAFADNIPTDLQKAAEGGASDLLMASLRHRLQVNHGLTEEASQWGVESWALALGLLDVGTARHKQMEPDRPQQEDAADVARPIWSVNKNAWRTFTLLIALTTGIYVAKLALSEHRLISQEEHTAMVRDESDRRSAVPLPSLKFHASSLFKKDRSGNSVFLNSVTIDGDRGNATGTAQIFRGNAGIDWKLFIKSVIQNVDAKSSEYKSSDYVLEINDDRFSFMIIHQSIDRELAIKSICQKGIEAILNGCLE